MKQYAILLSAVVALVIVAGCDRAQTQDDREFDADIDGLGSRLGVVSIPPALGADQVALARTERERIDAKIKAAAPPAPDPLDNTGLKPLTGTDAGAGTATTAGTTTPTGTGTGTGTTGTAAGTTGTGTTGTGTTGTGTGTGSSAIDDILGGGGNK